MMFSASPLTKQAGTVVDGRYEIESLIGVGGMSAVYRVRDTSLERIVALKMMHPHITENRSNVERFLQEAKAEGLIKHNNVINVRAVSATSDGHLYLVMDYLEGQSLSELIKEAPLKDQRQALDIFIQICSGLQAAHAQGVIHRDLKPSNVMIVGTTVKIVDFGIAKLISDTARELHLTKAGSVLGSPAYMSPEQCDAKSLDARSDIYSLGCLMYEVLAGRTPFDAESDLEVMCKHVSERAEPITVVAPWVAEEFQPIVAKCLQKNVVDRYQSIGELKDALEQLSLSMPAQPAPAKHRTQSNSRPATKKTGTARSVIGKVIAAGFAAIGMVSIGIIVGYVDKSHHKPVVAARVDLGTKVIEQIKAANVAWNEGKRREATAQYDEILHLYWTEKTMFQHTEIIRMLPHVVAHASVGSLPIMTSIAGQYLNLGNIGGAHIVADGAVELARKAKQPLLEGHNLVTLAECDIAMDRYDVALEEARQAAAAYKIAPTPDGSEVQRLSTVAKRLSADQLHSGESEEVYALAYNLAGDIGSDVLVQSDVAWDCAYMLRKQDQPKEAQPWYEKCLALREKVLKPGDTKLVFTIFETGSNLQLQHRYIQAKKYYDRCIADVQRIARTHPGSKADRMIKEMTALYSTLNQPQVAQELQSSTR
jgi:serine/threonine protein kinase